MAAIMLLIIDYSGIFGNQPLHMQFMQRTNVDVNVSPKKLIFSGIFHSDLWPTDCPKDAP